MQFHSFAFTRCSWRTILAHPWCADWYSRTSKLKSFTFICSIPHMIILFNNVANFSWGLQHQAWSLPRSSRRGFPAYPGCADWHNNEIVELASSRAFDWYAEVHTSYLILYHILFTHVNILKFLTCKQLVNSWSNSGIYWKCRRLDDSWKAEIFHELLNIIVSSIAHQLASIAGLIPVWHQRNAHA